MQAAIADEVLSNENVSADVGLESGTTTARRLEVSTVRHQGGGTAIDRVDEKVLRDPGDPEWDLESQGERTWLVTTESWGGLIARLFRKSSRKTLEKALRDGPGYLKAEAERI